LQQLWSEAGNYLFSICVFNNNTVRSRSSLHTKGLKVSMIAEISLLRNKSGHWSPWFATWESRNYSLKVVSFLGSCSKSESKRITEILGPFDWYFWI